MPLKDIKKKIDRRHGTHNRRTGERRYFKADSPDFSSRLEELLFERNLTNRAFAQKFGIAEATVSNYLRGDRAPGVWLFEDMCNYFNVSADWLLGRSDVKEVADGREEA